MPDMVGNRNLCEKPIAGNIFDRDSQYLQNKRRCYFMTRKICFLIALVVALAICINAPAHGQNNNICNPSVEMSCTADFGTFDNNARITLQCSGDSSNLSIGMYNAEKPAYVETAEGWVNAPSSLNWNGEGGPLMYSVSFTPNGTNGSFSGNLNVTYSAQCGSGANSGIQYIYLNIPYSGTTVTPPQ